MTSLVARLQEVLELKEPVEEARRKLRGTWMEVNGVLRHVLNIHSDSIVFVEEGGHSEVAWEEEKIKSLSLFMPQSGLYPVGDGCILIVRTPKRQWQKSYYDDLYRTKFVGRTKKISKFRNAIFQNRDKRQDIWIDHYKNIYYWDIHIGAIKGKEVYCLDENFKQELMDFFRDKQECL